MELPPSFRLSRPVPVPLLFLLFFIFNGLLAWGPGSGPWRWWIGLAGLGLTLIWDIRGPLQRSLPLGVERPTPLKVSGGILGGIFLLAFSLRFFRLTSLSVWPCYDDALWGWMALRFEETPGWPIFFRDSNFPSTHLGGLGLLFQWLGPSLATLWSYPAALSSLTVLVGHWAARQFFSPFLSLLMTLFLALSFWPLFVGRFADQMVLVLLWEFAYFGLLGFYIKKGASSGWGALGMGLASASGLYVFISCGPIALLGAGTLLSIWIRRRSLSGTPWLPFLLGGAVLILPLWKSGLGASLASYAHSGWWRTAAPNRDLSIPLSYMTTLFWGTDHTQGAYRPLWGGLLDPFLGAFFFLGLGELRNRGKALGLWLLAAGILFLLPGMATSSLEPFRILPILVPLGVLVALGWDRWLSGFRGAKAVGALLFSALIFTGLDQYHLQVKYGGFWDRPEGWRAYSKSPERAKAFARLSALASEKGPGLLYTDLVPGLCDVSLDLMDYPFNAAENPRLFPDQATWAAVLTNVNYRPFLSRRFPQGKAYALSQGLDRPDGGLMLWVFPIGGSDRPTLQKWQAAFQAYPSRPHWDPAYQLPLLLKAHPVFQGDPFLEASYGEKVSDLILRSSNFQDLSDTSRALDQAIHQGYPAAHLFWRLGVYKEMEGLPQEALQDYQKALRAPLDLTGAGPARERLERALQKP